jgi:choline dehydrogenase-like flavoprotein
LLLRRQGLGTASRELGRNLSIHPATALRAYFDEEIEMWRGVPQSYYVDEFEREGLMFEGAAGPPDYMAMSMPSVGEEHREQLSRYRHLAQFGVMVADTSRGEVRESLGRAVIRYDLNEHDTRTFKRGLELLAELYWAAGAREVHVPVRHVARLRDGDSSPLRSARVRAHDLSLMAFHPLGTARAGADPARAVIDGDLRVHGMEGVYVCDGSAVPSALGVNPQITIMTLATRLAYHLLGAQPPADEPAPERIARPGVGAAG